MAKRRCVDCEFCHHATFNMKSEGQEKTWHVYICRFDAPKPFSNQVDAMTRWPRVSAEDWCGKFQRAIE